MIGILIAVLVAALVYLILAALTGSAIVGDRRSDPGADRRDPQRRLRLRRPLGRRRGRAI